jgi:hypothetical protein
MGFVQIVDCLTAKGRPTRPIGNGSLIADDYPFHEASVAALQPLPGSKGALGLFCFCTAGGPSNCLTGKF